MKKFILANSGKEINFGDKVLIIENVNTPLSVAKVQRVAVVTKELMGKLIKDGKVNVVEENGINKIWNDAIKSLAKKTNWKEEKLLNILATLHLANPWAATQMVLREIAIELDKKYDDHINKSEKIYAISPQDGRIHEVNKKTVKNYKAFPAFRSIEDAKIAFSLIREHLKSIFSNA
mgnify:CR=1 FL=1|jgi:hypothetical protein